MARRLSHKTRMFAYSFLALRDGNICALCGKTPPEHPLEIDHINQDPHDDEPGNLRLLCKACNLGARNHSLATMQPEGANSPLVVVPHGGRES